MGLNSTLATEAARAQLKVTEPLYGLRGAQTKILHDVLGRFCKPPATSEAAHLQADQTATETRA
eukprot:6467988-Amphidinium_carterae.1